MRYIRLLGIAGFFFCINSINGMFSGKSIELRKKYYAPRRTVLGKKYPYIQFKYMMPGSIYEPLIGASSLEKVGIGLEQIYLIPIDPIELKNLDLCPLFVQQEAFALEPELVAEMVADFKRQGMSDEDINNQLATLSTQTGPQYHVFKEEQLLSSGEKQAARFERENVSPNVPCVVSLGHFGNWNRTLMQLKSLDQFELAERTGLSPALCAGHALNNCRLIRNYALTGNRDYLKDLHDIDKSAGFLRDLDINDWLNVETVKANIAKVGNALGVEGIDISAVSTAALFDSHLDKTEEFAVFNAEEFNYVQNIKKKIQEGLQQKFFVHLMVVGNEEVAESHGHYFCFAIIKAGDEIQYVVLDTLPGVYHLQEGSHERDRLMFIIQNIEQGNSSITLANLRVRPEFIKSLGEHTQESLLEGQLADERMEETGPFENQIKSLNNFSKLLNRFGIKKQLSKESKESLVTYLTAIQEISAVVGEDFAYPAMRALIVKRLSEMQ